MAVGRFQKTHALRGELNAILDIDPLYFSEDHPMIVNVEGAFVPFYVESVRGKGVSSWLVKISGMESQEESRMLVNETIYAEKDELRRFMEVEDEDLFMEDDLEGFRVIDEEFGELGEIERIDDTTANVLFVVKTPSDEEIFIPAADEFIRGIDTELREVITSLPESLVNLNIRPDSPALTISGELSPKSDKEEEE